MGDVEDIFLFGVVYVVLEFEWWVEVNFVEVGFSEVVYVFVVVSDFCIEVDVVVFIEFVFEK